MHQPRMQNSWNLFEELRLKPGGSVAPLSHNWVWSGPAGGVRIRVTTGQLVGVLQEALLLHQDPLTAHGTDVPPRLLLGRPPLL